ncbi:hypothetical protein CEXT_370561 [Caerostris extrusa]|uniref:Uncharacterized protein n=1 Tax=Caerostris extrusa TaxID=172846 RepID=A0AAV4Y1Y9_CAEEX|nr:hypothetical protein CEXT_370561 [Caerostris extrusa]
MKPSLTKNNTSSSAQALIKSAAEGPEWVSPFARPDISGERGCALCRRDPGLQIQVCRAAPCPEIGLSWANLIHGAECFCVSSF